jgi:hypothetical protein
MLQHPLSQFISNDLQPEMLLPPNFGIISFSVKYLPHNFAGKFFQWTGSSKIPILKLVVPTSMAKILRLIPDIFL